MANHHRLINFSTLSREVVLTTSNGSNCMNSIKFCEQSASKRISSSLLRFGIVCMMVCAILANNMDPRKTFLQTLVGLACYAQGLRDKGMKLLNSFGVTSSIFHIRRHGSYRSAIKELNPGAFWRATFDNLDFKIKFAKNISVGDT